MPCANILALQELSGAAGSPVQDNAHSKLAQTDSNLDAEVSAEPDGAACPGAENAAPGLDAWRDDSAMQVLELRLWGSFEDKSCHRSGWIVLGEDQPNRIHHKSWQSCSSLPAC